MGEIAGIKSSNLNTENQFKYINLMNYVNRDQEEITGAGKYYYPKRFL
jgi:hypothetical protein